MAHNLLILLGGHTNTFLVMHIPDRFCVSTEEALRKTLFRVDGHVLASHYPILLSSPLRPPSPSTRSICSSDVLPRLRAPPAPALQARSKPEAQARSPARPDLSPEPCPRRARGRGRAGRRAFAAVELRLPRAEAGA
jgi:hypothetical protein